jgi:hypothetical protein
MAITIPHHVDNTTKDREDYNPEIKAFINEIRKKVEEITPKSTNGDIVELEENLKKFEIKDLELLKEELTKILNEYKNEHEK